MNVFCFLCDGKGATLSIESCPGEISEQGFNFTITCTTNGPATYVNWTRDGVLVTEGTRTWLQNPKNVQYKHQLTGSFAGVYKCTLINKLENLTSEDITIGGDIILKWPLSYLCRLGNAGCVTTIGVLQRV